MTTHADPPGDALKGGAAHPPEAPAAGAPIPSSERPTATGAAFATRTGAPSRWRVAIVGAAALALVAGGVATSFAASPAPTSSPAGGASLSAFGPEDLTDGQVDPDHGRRGPRGFRTITITAISGSDVTLGTEDGWRRTIAITDAIDLTKGGQDIALSDLQVGDEVRFAQTRADDGTFTVTDLAVVVPTIRGTVSDVTASGFRITTRDGSVWTVSVDGSTAYRFGTADGTLADVTAGSTAIAAGTTTGDDQLAATGVRVAPDRAMGTVTAKTADTVTVTRRDGSSLTVHVDGDTTYRVAGVGGTASLADVAVEMKIGISGRARADGSIDADAIVAGNLRGLGRGGFDGPRPGADGALDDPTSDGGSSDGALAPIS